jgi:iron complex transport system permease protein
MTASTGLVDPAGTPPAAADDLVDAEVALATLPRRPGRLLVVLAVTLVVTAVVAVYNLTQGEPTLSLHATWDALWGGPGATEVQSFIVREIRLPRIVLSLLAGAALALAGVIMQDSLRNPIADPSLLGISQSAALVVSLVVLFPDTVPDFSTPFLCLFAGLATGAILVALARSIRDPVRLILIGFVLAMFYSTLTEIVTLLAPQDGANALSQFYRFEIGSVSGATWARLEGVWPWFLIAFPLSLLTARALNLLQLGDDVAAGLGMRVTRTRLIVLFIAVLLVAPAVSVAGPIAFVALMSPHIARFTLRTTNALVVLPASAAIGALTVLLADTAGRLLFFPVEVPAGLWTVVVIGPAAIWLAGSNLRGLSQREAAG